MSNYQIALVEKSDIESLVNPYYIFEYGDAKDQIDEFYFWEIKDKLNGKTIDVSVVAEILHNYTYCCDYTQESYTKLYNKLMELVYIKDKTYMVCFWVK